MFCTNCGKSIPSTANFCAFCGAKSGPPADASPSQPTPSAKNTLTPTSPAKHTPENDARSSGSSVLTWIWYLVVFALFNVLGRNFADAIFGPGTGAFIGFVLGILGTLAALAIWQKASSQNMRLLTGAGIVVAACVLALIAQVIKETAHPATQSPIVATTPAAQINTSNLTTSINGAPHDYQECVNTYALSGHIVRNRELIREWCQTAFDLSKHPVDRARSLCYAMGTKSNASSFHSEIYLPCDKNNPLPVCPTNQKFSLENRRCEIKCDALHGFAPDRTGQACYLACPNNEYPMYAGKVVGCME